MITPLERFILWVMFIAFVAVGMAGYVAYQDYVKPLIEMKERIEKIESIINKLPFKPFREGEVEVGGDCETGTLDDLPTDTLRNIRDEAQAIIERRNAGDGENGKFQEMLNEFLKPGHVKRAA